MHTQSENILAFKRNSHLTIFLNNFFLSSDNGKCDSEIQSQSGIAKDVRQKLNNLFRRVLNCCIISTLLYGSEGWIVSSQLKRRKGNIGVDIKKDDEDTIDGTCE